MATNYTRGADFERRVIATLGTLGWWCMRSAVSKGTADLIAISADIRPVLVQCKRTRRAVGPDEWNQFFRLSTALRCVPVLAVAVLEGRGDKDVVVGIDWRTLTGPKTPGTREDKLPWQPWEPNLWTPAGAVPRGTQGG